MPQETTKRELVYYQNESGKEPFMVWFDRLKDDKTREIIETRLARVQGGNLGNYASAGGGVWELKINYGPGFRIYFGQVGKTIIVLLCGGDKSKQSRDISDAQSYWEDYKNDAQL